ncbi:MAG: hypothetical protein M3Y75_03860 [Actinomycetota bacterium]|nr:hypothetical protein [Actinomycetota bacterium]
MNRTRLALLVPLTLVALLALAPAASAKTVAALPDLVVQKVSKPPKTETLESKLKMVVKVRNAGDAKAGKSKLGLYLGTGNKHRAKDRRLKRVKVKPLAAGKSKRLKLQVTLPTGIKAGSYRLFACADDTGKLKEEKERNCSATRKIELVRLNPGRRPITFPDLPPAPVVFTMGDGVDWGFVQNAAGESIEAGDPVTLNLTAGNGIPGQAGYTRSNVSSEGFRDGAATTLAFAAQDDSQVDVQLPFAFPFGGVREQSISVSTNGWVSFGSPAWDFWDDVQPYDYRGIQTVVGDLYRGLMPYWADLTIAAQGGEPGTVKQVVAPDNSWVAFQWDLSPLGNGAVRRTFQLVLFPDGRFRFDYPGENTPGGEQKSLAGYSLGTGAASADIVSAEGETVPPSGLVFTPKPLATTGGAAGGEMTATLPKGSTFSGAPGCALTTAPGPFNTGLVSCPVPGLLPGEQTSRSVTFLAPPDAPGENNPANFRMLGTYLSGNLKLTDGDEIDSLTTSLPPATIKVTPEYTGGNVEAGVPTTFEVDIESQASGLDEPTADFAIENATLSEIEIDGEPIECTALGGSTASCMLPSGLGNTDVDLTVVPISFGALTLKTTARALNAPEASANIGIFP